jgi:hypothetical protein
LFPWVALVGVLAAILGYCRNWGESSGAQVTTLFGTPEVQPKSKHTMLPILTVLFLISYGLMTLLIVEQGSTIQSQRTLIQQLLSDSSPVQTPSTQAVPSEKASNAHKNNKVQRPKHEMPPVPASDIGDARRTLMSI